LLNPEFSYRKENMKTAVRLMLAMFLFLGAASLLKAQTAEVTHNTWTTGTAMPTARMGAAAGVIGAYIYVIDGYTPSAMLGVNEIYNIKKNTWTTGAPDPNPRGFVASAVVNKIIYIFGGSAGGILNLTESYNPKTNTWTTLAPMPYVAQSASAVADKDVIYVIGGNDNDFLTNVASYNTTTNTWTEEAPLLQMKGWAAGALVGTTIVAADGSDACCYLGDNEAYDLKKNTWTELTADATPRAVGCYAVIKAQLYVAGGVDPNNLTVNESYDLKTNAWTTLAPMPQGILHAAASAESGGRMYCFGGGEFEQTVYDNVQIYQP
jgi:hypothetical protein